jgi:hypothetical protein
MQQNLFGTSTDIQNLITQVTENINVEDRKIPISHVKKIEAEYWARDHLLQEEIEDVIKSGGEDSDTDSSKDSDSSISS